MMRCSSPGERAYEPLYRARDKIRVNTTSHDVDATGWPEHSRAPRGGGTGEPWGGHGAGLHRTVPPPERPPGKDLVSLGWVEVN